VETQTLTQHSSYDQLEEGISIGELFHILKTRLKWIILTFILVMGAAFAYLNYVTPMYESEVTILVESLQKGSDFESMLLGQSSAKISTEVELTLSRSNIEKALKKLDLSQYYSEDGQPYSNEGVVGNVKSRTNVSTVKDTNIVRIKVTDQNPQFARDFANALAESYNELLGSIARNNKTVQKEFIQSQIPINNEQLQNAADALGRFREESNYIQLSDKSKLLSAKIAYFQLRREPLALQLNESDLIIEMHLNSLNGSKVELISYDKIIEDANVHSILDSYQQRSREFILYEAIQEGLTEESERMFVLQSSLNQTSKTLLDRINFLINDSLKDNDPLVVYTAFELAKAYHQKALTVATINVLEAIELTYSEELIQLPLLERQLLDLERDVQVYETLRMRLMELLEEVKIAEAAVAGSVTIVDPAIITVNKADKAIPVSPKRMLTLAIAALLGGALGVLFAFFMEMIDSTIKDEQTLRRIAGPNRPILGWIPLLSFSTELRIPSLIVYNDPLSFEAERYKLIANNLSFGTLRSNRRIFGITSSSIGEGKSTVAANVATSLAMNGLRVLLLEGDLRLPQLETFFNLKRNKKGLVDVVNGEATLEEVIIQPIKDVPLLHLLAPGQLPPLPSAIFTSSAYVELLNSLLKNYDYILIDTPPLVFASELMTIAQHVDGMAVNVRSGISSKGAVRELLDNFELADINVVGVIFNGVIESKMGGYYSGGRYYTYRGSGYAKRYYSNRYNSDQSGKKSKQSTLVKRGYRKAFLKDLKLREKQRHSGTEEAIKPYLMATETVIEKVVMQDHEIDPLTRIESDIYARGKVDPKEVDNSSS
jgi:succinoglycan biosynthesis transport protein ExoP